MNKCLAQYVEPLQDEVKSLNVSVGKLEEELGKAKLVVEPLEGKILILECKVADMSCDLSRVGLKAMIMSNTLEYITSVFLVV